MKLLRKTVLCILIVVFGITAIGVAINHTLVTVANRSYDVDYFQNDVFVNQPNLDKDSPFTFFKILYRRVTQPREAARPANPIPVVALTKANLLDLPDDGMFAVKLGHSSLLLKMNGEFWLVDPMFSNRASPFSFIGPKRFHAPALSLSQLPEISYVLLTHNHYDHLDRQSIQALKAADPQYFVPLGVGAELQSWGVPAKQINQFGWWDEQTLSNGKLAFTPAQHFSGRGLTDRNKSLWGSWVLQINDTRLFVSGDSGYFDTFKEIGKRYGPFDMGFIENGAYAAYWPGVHMTPSETVQAALDTKSRYLVPIHNSTFDLAFHPWFEPLEKVSDKAQQARVALLTPRFGEVINIQQPGTFPKWWKQVMLPRYR